MEKTKFKRRMFAVAAIVGMGMTMTQIAFGKESFNAENGGCCQSGKKSNRRVKENNMIICIGKRYPLNTVGVQNQSFHVCLLFTIHIPCPLV